MKARLDEESIGIKEIHGDKINQLNLLDQQTADFQFKLAEANQNGLQLKIDLNVEKSDQSRLQKLFQESEVTMEETNLAIRKRELQIQLLAKKPLRVTIGSDQRSSRSIDKAFSDIGQLVGYLAYPIESLMKPPKAGTFSLDDSIIHNTLLNSSGSAAQKYLQDGTIENPLVQKLAIFIFDNEPAAKMSELIQKLQLLVQQKDQQEEEEERKDDAESTPIKNWIDSSRMIIDSTPLNFTPICTADDDKTQEKAEFKVMEQ